MTEVKIR